MDVIVIHAAYCDRMREMELPAATLERYIAVTATISPYGIGYEARLI
jgi:hypothetical protein